MSLLFLLDLGLTLSYCPDMPEHRSKSACPEVAARLREAREKTGLFGYQVGMRLEVDKQTVLRWERGMSEPKASELKALCKLYNVRPDYILFGDEL